MCDEEANDVESAVGEAVAALHLSQVGNGGLELVGAVLLVAERDDVGYG